MEKRRGRGEETHCLNSLVSQSFLLVRTEWKGMERMNPLKRPRKNYAEREKRHRHLKSLRFRTKISILTLKTISLGSHLKGQIISNDLWGAVEVTNKEAERRR